MDSIPNSSQFTSKNVRKPKLIPRFKCDQCEYSTHYLCVLKKHAEVHLDGKPLACPVPGCSYTTKWKHSLVNHKTVHEDATTVWYQCDKCDFKTKYKYVLEKRHAKLHSEGPIPRRYKCDLCEYGSDSRPSFLEHRKNHNEDVKRLACDVEGCEYTALWKSNMFQHKKRCHSEIIWYKCDQCNHKTQFKDNLKIHAVTHSEEKPHSCPYPSCEFTSRTVACVRGHQNRLGHFVTSDGKICKKTPPKRHECTKSGCKFASVDSGDLKKHLKTHDPNRERNFKCPLCTKSFFNMSGLKAHASHHTNESPFLCSFPNCNFKAIYPSEVKKHERVHVEGKSFACTFQGCEAKFKLADYLKKHERIHVGGKLFTCTFEGCEANFKMACYLKRHLLCHDPERRPKFTCNLCSLEFLTSSGLRNHINVHTNEKPYDCANCGYSTAESYKFKRHECVDGNKMDTRDVKRIKVVSKFVVQLADGNFGCKRCTFASKSKHGAAVHSGRCGK